jgi:ComF family protein
MPGLAAALHRLSPGLLPLLPRQCEVCRQWSAEAVCADCVARWAAARPRCVRCGLQLGMQLGLTGAVCGDCLRAPPPFERTLCAVDYAFPWDALTARFKFNGQVELASAFAARMAAAVQTAAAPLPTLLLPVPLSAQRLAERGYNQAWELARRLAVRLHLEADATLLQRPLDTAHQAGLDRGARQRNLRTAFMVDARRRGEVAGRRVALVDDVMTTGATAREAAAVLLRAGAAAVEVWVLARTPAS